MTTTSNLRPTPTTTSTNGDLIRPGDSVLIGATWRSHQVVEVLFKGEPALATKCHRRVVGAERVDPTGTVPPPCAECMDSHAPSRLSARRPAYYLPKA